jgi:hypothetical protein
MPVTKVFDIRNLGTLGPSRIYNLDAFLHKSIEPHYINQSRNRFKEMKTH